MQVNPSSQKHMTWGWTSVRKRKTRILFWQTLKDLNPFYKAPWQKHTCTHKFPMPLLHPSSRKKNSNTKSRNIDISSCNRLCSHSRHFPSDVALWGLSLSAGIMYNSLDQWRESEKFFDFCHFLVEQQLKKKMDGDNARDIEPSFKVKQHIW